jgi:hypothetical protein
MVFKPKPSGEQRTAIYKIRVKPHFKGVMEEKLEMYRELKPDEEFTVSDLIRKALDQFFRDENDPRDP